MPILPKTRGPESLMWQRLILAAIVLAITVPLATSDQRGARIALAATAAGALMSMFLTIGGPAMSKPNKKRFKLEEIRTRQAEKSGGAEIDIETPDGQEFTLAAPGFWPDEAADLMGKGQEVRLATILIGGPEEYARFKAAGGRAQDVALVINEYAESQGVTPGESGASSS